jgi:hypothetical protein
MDAWTLEAGKLSGLIRSHFKVRDDVLETNNLRLLLECVVIQPSCRYGVFSPMVELYICRQELQVSPYYQKNLHNRLLIPRGGVTMGEDVLYRAGGGGGMRWKLRKNMAISVWRESLLRLPG